MTFTDKSHGGNRLEKDVFVKLQDAELLTCLQADSLMYHHVYADLVVLAKSKELHKSVFDMRQHYLELKLFLQELQQYPEIVINRYHQVFVSEPQLYAKYGKMNHRDHKHTCHPYECVQESLFHNLPAKNDIFKLFLKITGGAKRMVEKLCNYAADYLPGGIYWDPDSKTSKILQDIEPSNDLCESILGLNDYLTTSLPNLQQITKSILVEIKKNGTMKWFSDLPSERQTFIIELAQRNRVQVRKAYNEEQQQLIKKRQENMLLERQKDRLKKQNK